MSPTAKLTEEYHFHTEHKSDTTAPSEIESSSLSETDGEWCANRETDSEVRDIERR